jgi:glyoxylase-like metal-dependent hydrolase (beta-lactamase superfamily II)
MNFKTLGFTLALGIVYSTVSSQNPVFENYYRASNILDSAIVAYGGIETLEKPSHFSLQGSESFFGHYNLPEKPLTVPLKGSLSFFQKDQLLANFTVIESGETYTGKLLLTADSSYQQEYGESGIAVNSRAEAISTYFYFPVKVLAEILKNRTTLHFLESNSDENILGFNTGNGTKYYAYLNKSTYRISKLEHFFYSPVYGDATEEILYENYSSSLLPAKIIVKKNGLVQRDLSAMDFKTETSLDSAAIRSLSPNALQASLADHEFEIVAVGGGISILKLNEVNNKILVVEYKDHLAVFEAPVSVDINRKAIQYLKTIYPNKKIKYCFLSHHHPDHAGGFLAYAEEGSTIITTLLSAAYLDKLSAGKHSFSFNTVSSFKTPAYDIIRTNTSKEFFKKDTPVVVYETGSLTDHTDEYLFFYFPAQRILFIGDLVMFPSKGLRQQGKRAYGVYTFIKQRKLAVDKIYTSWPLYHQKDYGTADDLTNSLTQVYPELKEGK